MIDFSIVCRKWPYEYGPSCIKNETYVREAEGIFKIEVPDNVILVSNNRKSL
jgi:hypothetical protein